MGLRPPAVPLRASTVRLADLPHHCVHIGVVPDLGELAVFDAIKSELRNSHPTIGCLNSLEGPPAGTRDREVHRDIVAVDDEVRISQYQSGNAENRGANCAATAAGSVEISLKTTQPIPKIAI